MSNDYYNVTGAPVTHSAGRSAVIRDEYTLIQQGFDKLPTQTEIDILKGATVTTAELNLLDGVIATTAEINVLSGIQGKLDAKADIAGETYSGNQDFTNANITVSTKLAGSSGNQAASLDFVNAVSFASYANLPGQTGLNGAYLSTDGNNASWAYVTGSDLALFNLGII